MNAITHQMSSAAGAGRGSRRLPASRAGASRPAAAPVPAGPRPAGTMAAAVWVIYAAAILEVAAVITIAVTYGSVHAAVLAADPRLAPAQWDRLAFEITARAVSGGFIAVLLAWLARANGRGQDWARLVLCAVFSLSALGLLISLSDHVARYATADLAVGSALLLAQLAAVVLVFTPQASRYYRRESDR